jgi:predicted O-methyltransferase YrrM
MNEWLEKYRHSMSCRYWTFKAAFDLLYQMPRHRILETGCIRMENDWGAGCSTLLFGEFCELNGGRIMSVDLFPNHLETAKRLTAPYNHLIDYVESDSVAYLKTHPDQIDLLYLDSMDVPMHDGADRVPCQEHCLNEFKAAEDKLHAQSIVLIDDYFNGNGKGRLAEKYLMDNGWRRVFCFQQQLFVR